MSSAAVMNGALRVKSKYGDNFVFFHPLGVLSYSAYQAKSFLRSSARTPQIL